MKKKIKDILTGFSCAITFYFLSDSAWYGYYNYPISIVFPTICFLLYPFNKLFLDTLIFSVIKKESALYRFFNASAAGNQGFSVIYEIFTFLLAIPLALILFISILIKIILVKLHSKFSRKTKY